MGRWNFLRPIGAGRLVEAGTATGFAKAAPMTTAITTGMTAPQTSAAAPSSLAIDMDQFLQILVTQLENQNPLEPTDTSEFTNQLVGYAQLGQQTLMNETLGGLSSSLTALMTAQSASYVGQTVEIDSASAPLQNGKAAWTYTVEDAAASTVLVVTDPTGKVVWSGAGTAAPGQTDFALSLEDLSGVEEGDVLTLTSVSTNVDGGSAANAVTSFATLDAVVFSNGDTLYQAGDALFDPSAVLAMYGKA